MPMPPDYLTGTTQQNLYILTAETCPPEHITASSQDQALTLHWLDRPAFFFQLLRGCNLLRNTDFSGDGENKLADWLSDFEAPANIGVDFSEKWQLNEGHTAYLFAPSDAKRPCLRLANSIPLIPATELGQALPYRLSGFFASHRGEGRITIDYLTAAGEHLETETIFIPYSSHHQGGQQIKNYQYLQWQLQPAPAATQLRLSIVLDDCTEPEAANSFLFLTHLFLGVATPEDPGVWSPFCTHAETLCRAAQNPDWQHFGLASLAPELSNSTIVVNIADITERIDPETFVLPAYLCNTTLHSRAQAIAKLFDPLFYAHTGAKALAILDNDALLTHYQTTGWQENRSPSPYFDVNWYRVNNPDVNRQHMDPLHHFIDSGSAARRSPHPLFDAEFYYQSYLAKKYPNVEPLFHYLDKGWRLGYQPHPLFWTAWYARQYLGANAGQLDPFYHYVTEGWCSGCQPNPLFDPQRYLKEYGSKSRIEPDPLSHYVHVGWRDNNHPHLLFDANYYAMQTGYNSHTASRSALEDFFTHADFSVSPHPLFDANFYCEQLDRKPNEHPLIDYLERGWRGQIDPNPLFSKSYYYKNAKQAVTEKCDALLHYLDHGWKQKQPVHPLFDTPFYLEQNPKAQGCIPLQHYLVHGWSNGFSCRPVIDDKKPNLDEPKQQKLPKNRIILNIPNDRLFAPLHSSYKTARIGVFAHIFYADLTAEMIEACNHIPGNCTVFISTDKLVKAKQIDEACRQLSKHPFEIRVTPNRGRDIAPMISGFRDRLQQVDYGVHIHSKRSNHFDADFANDWRRHLIAGNLGSPELVTNILNLLADDNIGIYAPDHYPPMRPAIKWTGNFELAKNLLQLCGEQLNREHLLDFPSGSMFWFKTKALKPLLNLSLRPYHFDAEQGHTDNTLAHALERCFYYFAEIAGYAWIVGKPVNGEVAEQALTSFHAAKASANLFGNRIFPNNRELGGLRNYFGQCTRFLSRPSQINKPRINLLLPTLHSGQGHIDSTRALLLFNAIRKALGDAFDARLITTDVSPEQLLKPPVGYRLSAHTKPDQAGQDTITDAAQRFRYPFSVRDHDVFVATAWWTALHAQDIIKQQNQLFGVKPRRFVYFIQDIEFSNYPWSTQSMLAEQTYQNPTQTIPVFTSHQVFDYFQRNGYFSSGPIVQPLINPHFKQAINYGETKEKIVLLATRPHIERHGQPFVDVLIQTVIDNDPKSWSDWRFCVVGDHLNEQTFKNCKIIEVFNALPIPEYAKLASKAALGITLMISPQPGHLALELAEAGVLVLTNNHTHKHAEQLHDNIVAFDRFDIDSAAAQLQHLAEQWLAQPDLGWQGQSKTSTADGDTLLEAAKWLAEQIKSQS